MKFEAQETLRLVREAMGLSAGLYTEVKNKEENFQDSTMPV